MCNFVMYAAPLAGATAKWEKERNSHLHVGFPVWGGPVELVHDAGAISYRRRHSVGFLLGGYAYSMTWIYRVVPQRTDCSWF